MQGFQQDAFNLLEESFIYVTKTDLNWFQRRFNIGQFLLLNLLLLDEKLNLSFLQVVYTLVYDLLPDPEKMGIHLVSKREWNLFYDLLPDPDNVFDSQIDFQ